MTNTIEFQENTENKSNLSKKIQKEETNNSNQFEESDSNDEDIASFNFVVPKESDPIEEPETHHIKESKYIFVEKNEDYSNSSRKQKQDGGDWVVKDQKDEENIKDQEQLQQQLQQLQQKTQQPQQQQQQQQKKSQIIQVESLDFCSQIVQSQIPDFLDSTHEDQQTKFNLLRSVHSFSQQLLPSRKKKAKKFQKPRMARQLSNPKHLEDFD
ncbi:hypothetical protein M0813_14107 [Anaeramoeba flamelloides]|uniref:Uncharacterized protein n=1 Tax=Anaeramoeba flamelloides TaxID=1746091 RepID=A0ABQ8Z702_9EUKA|nr:hypothetical protein M0813_14107 [Anaeramoeba flamelloides]